MKRFGFLVLLALLSLSTSPVMAASAQQKGPTPEATQARELKGQMQQLRSKMHANEDKMNALRTEMEADREKMKTLRTTAKELREKIKAAKAPAQPASQTPVVPATAPATAPAPAEEDLTD